MPGFSSPIELSMPASVSAIRTGRLPSRGCGVTVFVTNASSARATSGASSASRQPDALKIMPPPGPARRRRVAAARRRSRPSSRSRRRSRRPSELPRRAARPGRAHEPPRASARGRTRRPCNTAVTRSVRGSVTSVGSTTTSAFGTSAAASACQSLRKPRIAGGLPRLVGEVRKRSDADAAADEERFLDVEPVAVPERAEDVELVARFGRGQRAGSRPDRLEQEAELTGKRLAEAHRARQEPSRRLEHEELARAARLEPASFDPDQRIGADRPRWRRTLSRSLLRTDSLLERDREVAPGRPRSPEPPPVRPPSS